MVRHAMDSGTDLFCTLFDLENAYGSVEHGLVSQTLASIRLPKHILEYFATFYDNISGHIKGPWGKVEISFKRGLYQGDPLSCILFNLVAEPLFETLSVKNVSKGFAYADDSGLATLDVESHFQITHNFSVDRL